MFQFATTTFRKWLRLDKSESDGDNLPSLQSTLPVKANDSKSPILSVGLPSPILKSNFISQFANTLCEETGDVLLTAYDDHQVGRIFLLAYKAEDFVDFLDALTENAELDCVEIIPPVGTRVVARVGRDGDERDDDVPLLKKLGGIHNKPWRGIVKHIGDGTTNKAVITFTDLGMIQEVDMSDIFMPTDLVSTIPLDKFGGWVQISRIKIADGNRRFYQSTYRDLMQSLLFANVQVDKVEEYGKGNIGAEVKLKEGSRRKKDLTMMVEKLQHWEYEKMAKENAVKNTTTIMEFFHGSCRIKFEDIAIPRCLRLGKSYTGMIQALCEKSEGIFLFHVLSGEDKEEIDDARIWDLHLNNYYNLVPHCSSWFPIVDEVFLMRTEIDDNQNGRWRRVIRKSHTEVWDLDDATFSVQLEQLPSNFLIRPAPKELLDLPVGPVRMLIPGYKTKHFNKDSEEKFFNEPFTVRILSYDEKYLAHVVEADGNFMQWATRWWLEPV